MASLNLSIRDSIGAFSNVKHDPSRSNVAVAVCTTSLVLALIVFAARVYTRLAITRSFEYDDCKSS